MEQSQASITRAGYELYGNNERNSERGGVRKDEGLHMRVQRQASANVIPCTG